MRIGENTRHIISRRLAQSTSHAEIDYCLELWVQTHGYKQIHFIGLTSQLAFNRNAFFIHSQDHNFINEFNRDFDSEAKIGLRQCIISGHCQTVEPYFAGQNKHILPVNGPRLAAGLFIIEDEAYKPMGLEEKILIAQELIPFKAAIFKTYLPKFDPEFALTQRESEVLSWVAQGKSNSVIAEIMQVSPHTIDNYLRRTYAKIGVNNRTSAAVKALLLGLSSI